jgi:hypothetical protein
MYFDEILQKYFELLDQTASGEESQATENSGTRN